MSKDGGPAFPTKHWESQAEDIDHYGVLRGMSLRDYFAAAALRGCCEWDAIINGKNAQFANVDGLKTLAELSYAIADAMLAERNK